MGVVITAVAIAASSAFRSEYDATIRPGQVMNAGSFDVRLDQLWARDEPQRTVVGASLTILRGGQPIGEMQPRTNYYALSQEPVPTPAVRSRPAGDLYINLMAFAEDGSTATLRVIVEPLVPWIWFGGGVVCMGAIISMLPGARRRREVEVLLEEVPEYAA
jgi:cytochrome c-type biogenesis protein CcmF